MSGPVLAIGPANYAGQAYEWAEAVNRHSCASAWAFMRGRVRRRDYGFPAHRIIHPLDFYFSPGRGWRSLRLFSGTTHIALDGYEAYFRRPRALTIYQDGAWLGRQGFEMALIAHGTDVRDPVRHMERLRWSFFNEGSAEWVAALDTAARRNRQIALDLGYPLFASTPDLLIDQPTARWLPLSIDPVPWATSSAVLERKVPRVLHLPSRRNPPIKGTQYVDPLMRKLEAAGAIEYVSPVSVPHSEMRGLVHSCDIVVDQILTGSYGVAAIEAMAAGRVVVGGMAADVKALIPESPQLYDADPDSLETVFERILSDREEARATALANVEFVHRWHDGRAAATALADYLGVSSEATD